MKKTLLLLAIALTVNGYWLTANGQSLITNTVSPKDLSAYDGQSVDLTLFRYIYKGWNTVCLPVSLTTEELNAVFGEECRLETLVGVETDGTTTKLNFRDVKPDGLKAQTPYILYSTLESGVRTIRQSSALIETGDAELNFADNARQTVSFAGAGEAQPTTGMYGIIARDNQTAAFVDASQVPTIYSTRCYIKLNGGELTQTLDSNHLPYDMTAIEDVAADTDAADQSVDVYNVMGVRIATAVAPADLARVLPRGVYVIKGKTFWNR